MQTTEAGRAVYCKENMQKLTGMGGEPMRRSLRMVGVQNISYYFFPVGT